MAKRMIAAGKLKGGDRVVTALKKALNRYLENDECASTWTPVVMKGCNCDFCVGARALNLADNKGE